VIVVAGSIAVEHHGSSAVPVGIAAHVATALAHAGEAVEVVSKVGVDAAGESVISALAAAGIGHVALQRDAVNPTPSVGEPPLLLDAGDLQLALRYLTAFEAVLLIDPIDPAAVRVAQDACEYVGARLVITRLSGATASSANMLDTGAPALEVLRSDGDESAALPVLLGLLSGEREVADPH
jgi:hypothetical protein